MLRTRVLTALVLLAILLPSIFAFPPIAWGAVSLVFLAAAGYEWATLMALASVRPARLAALMLILGALWLALLHEFSPPPWVATAVYVMATAFWLVVAPFRLRAGNARAGGIAVPVALLLACWMALFDLRTIGPLALLAAMAVIWVADVFAYFVGRAIGRRRLAPAISPGKTWEGALGGAAAVVAVGLVAASVPALGQSIPAVLVARLGMVGCGLVLVVLVAASIVGDLHESLLKRQAGVKDSGRTLPGHGGVLDRIDALVPTMPMIALLYRIA